jgi:hypothetical protein
MKTDTKPAQAVEAKILAAIKKRGRGTVFLPSDFLGLGSREAIDIALHRLHRKGAIRRLARGLYDYPREHAVLGPLFPSAETVAQALAGRDGTRLQPGDFRARSRQSGVLNGRRKSNREYWQNDHSAPPHNRTKHGNGRATEWINHSSLT